ncbi:MAG: formate/nitrite transporter family protein [Eubacteriales bacterium]|nr:formate/nitrite transporter family protein [Lachnospiraceae bacterium]MDO5128250.1 formate/nitrite transporter family protein [Eubacteriales bacterium]
MHSPLEIATNFVEIGIHKVRLSAWKMIVLGMFAGMFIGFAGIASTTASATVTNPAVARLLSACVFPAGLAMVLVAGSELFTGNNLIIISVLQKQVTILKMLKNWLFVFLGNFLGAAFVAVMVVYGHLPDLYDGMLAQKMVVAANARVTQGFMDAMIRGILCNILVCIAVWAAFAAKKVSGKLLMSFWPVMLFVLCGFEHSIADIYFCIAGLFTSAEYGIVAEGLTFGSFLTNNLLPVTLGNIIGGAGIVGVGYWMVYLAHTPGYAMPIEAEQEEIDMAEEY